MPRFSITGRLERPDLREQREVLHVAGADLEHVGFFGHSRHVLGREHLGHDGQAVLAARFDQHVEALVAEPLEAVGRSARLETATAENVRTLLLHLARAGQDLLEGLDRAGAGDDDEVIASDAHAADVDDRVLGLVLAARETVTGRALSSRGPE